MSYMIDTLMVIDDIEENPVEPIPLDRLNELWTWYESNMNWPMVEEGTAGAGND